MYKIPQQISYSIDGKSVNPRKYRNFYMSNSWKSSSSEYSSKILPIYGLKSLLQYFETFYVKRNDKK